MVVWEMKRKSYAAGRRKGVSSKPYKRVQVQTEPTAMVVEPQSTVYRAFVPRTMGAASMTERKYYTTGLTATNVQSAATWAGTELDPAANCLFAPTEGSDINNRVGRKVTVHKITVRGHISVAAQTAQAAMDDASLIRMVLYMDMQTNGTQSQGEELLQNPTVAQAANAIQTYQNSANFGRFRVLKDKMIAIGVPNAVAATAAGNTVEVGGAIRQFKFSHVFKKPIVVRFNATNGGTVADIVDNSFHLIANTNSTALVPRCTYECRTVYTDI